MASLSATVETLKNAGYGERLGELEQKLTTVSVHLDMMERMLTHLASSQTRGNRSSQSSYQRVFQQPEVQLQSFEHENLARRLGISPTTLTSQREALASNEFTSWTRNRDPRSCLLGVSRARETLLSGEINQNSNRLFDQFFLHLFQLIRLI